MLTGMEDARVCLSPLRFGAGIKGKLLEAMIMQTPSVTTPIGSEGMYQNEPWSGVICDTHSNLQMQQWHFIKMKRYLLRHSKMASSYCKNIMINQN